MKKEKASRQKNVLMTQERQSSIDYAALLGAIEQAHQMAQHQAVHAVNMGLTLRN